MLIERKVYELPTVAQHNLKVIEIGEMKKVQTKFGLKDKFTVKFEVCDQKTEAGDEPILVFQTFAPSVGDKSNLGKFLRKLGFDTSSGDFEMDDLLGFKFTAFLAHNKGTGDAVYANIVIDTVQPARSMTPGRAVAKNTAAPVASKPAMQAPKTPAMPAPTPDDEDIPF